MSEPLRDKALPPVGTVAILFTDIEGSTALWEQDGARMSQALAAHDALARRAVEAHHGSVVKMMGDGMHAVFDDGLDALAATVDLQQAFANPAATGGVDLRVRCGLHAGVVERRDNDYFGSSVNRTARIMSAAHGGQILLSQAMVDCVRERLPALISLHDIGAVRLKDLATPERLYQLVHPDLRHKFPALRSLETTPNNLPQQFSSFIGRGPELSEAKRLLTQSRLLTLVGIGGIGKTRLSLQVAADILDTYPDGVWFVEFAAITDPLLIASSVAQVLRVQESPGTQLLQTLCTHLKSRSLLLVLDNCEHMIKPCARLAGALLAAAPDIRILATSREPLHVDGEQTFPLPPLSVPAPDAASDVARTEAVQLFVERARLQQPGFVLTDRQLPAVAELCIHLDGIPWAVELAAARAHSLSIEDINARLKDRFNLLTGGSLTKLPRQQTLRAMLDWSYELLSDEERAVLNRLAIFVGGFTLDAGSSVASDDTIDETSVVDLVSQLVMRSLVAVDISDAVTRYRLLEMTRAYALEKLDGVGETDAIQRRHAQHFRDMFARASDEWLELPEAVWSDHYLPERDNVRAALAWALGKSVDPANGIALASAAAAVLLGFRDRKWLETAVAKITSETPEADEARLWLWLGVARSSAPATAVPAFERAIFLYRRLDDAAGLGHALSRLAGRLVFMGRFEQAASVFEEALPVLERTGWPKALASYFEGFGFFKMLTGDIAASRMHYERALSLYRRAGARRRALSVLGMIAESTWALGDLDGALAAFREVIQQIRVLHPPSKGHIGEQLLCLAGVHAERGELDEALEAAREGLLLLKDEGSAWVLLDHVALRAAAAGKFVNAAQIAGYTDAANAANETSRQPNQARARDRLQKILREKLTHQELERLFVEGAKLSEDEVCRIALEE